jgi:Copper transport outer membrane protein, MctB
VINLRYHIVSITAVFLALGIGITMGSTFLGRGALDRIDQNVKNAQAQVEATKKENAELRRDAERDQGRAEDFMSEVVQRMFDGQLEDVPVLVLAAPGIDKDSLDVLTDALIESDATYLGRLTVTQKMAIEGGDVENLADLLQAISSDAAQLRSLVTQRMARDMRAASRDDEGDEPPQSTVPESSESLVGTLVEGDFLSYEPGGFEGDVGALLTGQGYRYVVVTGPSPDVPDSAFLLPLVREMAADRPAQVVVAAAATGDDAETEREVTLQPYLDDEAVAERISTVDNLESINGIAAVMDSLTDLGVDRRGHYGFGEGRTQLPPDSS